jgi:16S rRNA (cytidine1402-2'-O)-methyltransferase
VSRYSNTPIETQPSFSSGGVLYVVATPIGNLSDLSPRARSILAEVDLIAAEDTRHSSGLLQHCGIHASMVSLHEHNEAQQSPQLVSQLQAGKSIALISDAGTPAISDPGSRLVALAHANQLSVVAIPGPSALTAAVSVSGFSALPIQFHGFLPAKAKSRKQVLETLIHSRGTLVFYEAPHRIEEMVSDLEACFPAERSIVLCRELTKRFESVHRCSLGDAKAWLADDPDHVRGEFVVVLEGAPEHEQIDPLIEGKRVLEILSSSLSMSEAARAAAKITGANRSDLYSWALNQTQMKSDSSDPDESD